MGLAASQAKLLTITSRLSDNELRSQSVTAAKMALASQSSDASRRYINSLNATEFNYKTYDADGDKVQVPLTGLQMITYAPLKNQYALINNSGQILLTEVDANNYNASANMDEFLAKYGVDKIDTGETNVIPNLNYQEEWDAWIATEPTRDMDEFWDRDPSLANTYFYAMEDNIAAATEPITSPIDILNIVPAAMRLIGSMLELTMDSNGDIDTSAYPKSFMTSTGQTANLNHDIIVNDTFVPISRFGTTGLVEMQEVSDAISNGYQGRTLYAKEDPTDTLSPYTRDDLSRLLSNYTFDSDGNKILKTLKQKCIDLYYAITVELNNDPANFITNWNNYIGGFSPHRKLQSLYYDLAEAMSLNQTRLNEAHDEWLAQSPLNTVEEPIYKYNDSDKAQWYINLWHRVNGASEEKDGTETVTTTTHGAFSEYGSESTSVTETSSRYRYEILEDGLMNSQQWLKYALETGAVSLERVNFAEETTGDTGLKKAEWKSIIYTNALDITEQSDEHAMAVAEAEYEQAQREIENKDKQYDSILKLLDTEHNALQTEYESVKKVISKNMERTLSIYKA